MLALMMAIVNMYSLMNAYEDVIAAKQNAQEQQKGIRVLRSNLKVAIEKINSNGGELNSAVVISIFKNKDIESGLCEYEKYFCDKIEFIAAVAASANKQGEHRVADACNEYKYVLKVRENNRKQQWRKRKRAEFTAQISEISRKL